MKYIKIFITLLVIICVLITCIFNKNTTVDSSTIQTQERTSKRGKSETICAEEFTKIITQLGGDKRNISYNVRPDWLINPETGRRLELDMYYSDSGMDIAVEYNGIQHIVYPNYFHPNTEDGRSKFEAQQRRDQYKRYLCRQNNICLINVPYTCDTCDYRDGRYIPNSKISISERRRRIKEYLLPRIHSCLLENR